VRGGLLTLGDSIGRGVETGRVAAQTADMRDLTRGGARGNGRGLGMNIFHRNH
jgi:hypothetical protein